MTIFIVNGVKMFDHPRQAFAVVMTSINLQFWSPEAVSELIEGTILSLREYSYERMYEIKAGSDGFLPKSERRHRLNIFSRFLSWSNNVLRELKRKDRDQVKDWAYNLILSSEGMSPLPGFGMTNKHKDYVPGNPEYQSIRV